MTGVGVCHKWKGGFDFFLLFSWLIAVVVCSCQLRKHYISGVFFVFALLRVNFFFLPRHYLIEMHCSVYF